MSVFKDVRYFISPTIRPYDVPGLGKVLDTNGATCVDSIQDATHVISNTDRFVGCEALPEGTHVCTGYWVERCVILGKPQPPEHYSANPAMIFSGVVACSANLASEDDESLPQLSPADEEALSGTIIALGGQYRAGLTRDVTHLFALKPEGDRYETALHFQSDTGTQIVVPHWFDDCVMLGRRLDTTPYSWPEPQVLQRTILAPEAAEADKVRDRAASTQIPEEKRQLFRGVELQGKVLEKNGDHHLPEYETRDAWGGRKILLSVSLGLSPKTRQAVEAGIWRAGGTVLAYSENKGTGTEEEELNLVEDADVLVTRYRRGWPYINAVREKKLVGTLAWVFHVESTGILSSPTDQLLHYPIHDKPIEGFHQELITITNYTGEARDYLKRLITVMGAKFTPNMSQANTTLVAAYMSGNKTDRARLWNIAVVNHLWLEDCFAQWKKVPPAVDKYISFPPGVDFSNHLGEKGDRASVDPDTLKAELAALEQEAGPIQSAKRVPKPSSKKAKVVASAVDMGHAAETFVFVEQEIDRPTSQEDEAGPSTPPRKKLVRRSGSRKEASSLFEVEGLLSGEAAAPADDDGEDEVSPPAPKPRIGPPRKKGKAATKAGEGALEPDATVAKPKLRKAAKNTKKLDDAESDASAPPDAVPATLSARASTLRSPGKKAAALRRDSDRENDAEAGGASTTPPAHNADKALPSSSKLTRTTKSTAKGKAPAPQEETEDEEPLSDAPVTSPIRKRAATKKPAAVTESPAPPDTSMIGSSQGDSFGRVRRGAAMRAGDKLKTDMEDLRNFESQRRRGVITGSWEKSDKPSKPKDGKAEESNGQKKRGSTANESQDEEETTASARQPKKRKTAPAAAPKGRKNTVEAGSDGEMDVDEAKPSVGNESSVDREVRVLTSQYALTAAQEKGITKLGILKATSPEECTHLIMKELARTEKLLEVLPTVQYLVPPEWLDASIKAKELLPAEDFVVPNAPPEKDKFGIPAAEVMRRRDAVGGQLFAGHTFYITPGVKDETKLAVLRTAIQANGGKVATQAASARNLDGDDHKHLVSCEADGKVWRPLASKRPVFNKEFVLTSAGTQKMDLEDMSQRVPGSF